MNKYFALFLVSLSCTMAKLRSDTVNADILIRNARMITGTGVVHENACLEITRDKIVAFNPEKPVFAKTIIDASGQQTP